MDKEAAKRAALANRRVRRNDDNDQVDVGEGGHNSLPVCDTRRELPVPALSYKPTAPSPDEQEQEESPEKAHSKAMLQRLLQQQQAEREASKRQADNNPLSVDDTDYPPDVEPDSYLQWKLRELQRLQRELGLQVDEEQLAQKSADNKEIEEELRPRFLQKYYHPGAFYQDLLTEEQRKRAVVEPTAQDKFVDRSTLPSVLQVRDFGKRGRTKWTHLTKEDTTNFQYGWGTSQAKRPAPK
jgi:microfibrillar-associated protein 1